MHIGILQTGHIPDEMRPSSGDYDVMFAKLLAKEGLSFTAYDVENLTFPDGVTTCDGWLVTGSRHGVYEDHAFIPPLEIFIRDAYDADVPMVGICFGHQIIAQALGGHVEKFDGGWAVGRQDYEMGDQTLALNAWHQDQVIEPPKGATRVASNAFCENAGLVYGKKAFTVQPHPEFESDVIQGLITHRGTGVVPEDQLKNAAQELEKSNDNENLARMIGQFFRERAIQ